MDILLEHDYLNGSQIVAMEFLLVAGIALFMGVRGLQLGQPLAAAVGFGICANSVIVARISAQRRLRGERSGGLRKLLDAKYRREAMERYPHLPLHTLVLVAALLVPFCVPVVLTAQKSWGRVG
jgi:hypothetical protein